MTWRTESDLSTRLTAEYVARSAVSLADVVVDLERPPSNYIKPPEHPVGWYMTKDWSVKEISNAR